MSLHNLSPNEGSRRPKRRVCRGIGSGLGKTGGRGTKGQKARRQIPAWFEGGQTPIHRRLPIKKGFRNINHKEYFVINLNVLQESFEAGDTVTPEILFGRGLASKHNDGIKVLGFGTLEKKLKISAHKFSKTAIEAIEKAGGEVTIL